MHVPPQNSGVTYCRLTLPDEKTDLLFIPFWERSQQPTVLKQDPVAVYILDGVTCLAERMPRSFAELCRHTVLAICRARNTENWIAFLKKLPAPDAAVIDGQKGLLAAIPKPVAFDEDSAMSRS